MKNTNRERALFVLYLYFSLGGSLGIAGNSGLTCSSSFTDPFPHHPAFMKLIRSLFYASNDMRLLAKIFNHRETTYINSKAKISLAKILSVKGIEPSTCCTVGSRLRIARAPLSLLISYLPSIDYNFRTNSKIENLFLRPLDRILRRTTYQKIGIFSDIF